MAQNGQHGQIYDNRIGAPQQHGPRQIDGLRQRSDVLIGEIAREIMDLQQRLGVPPMPQDGAPSAGVPLSPQGLLSDLAAEGERLEMIRDRLVHIGQHV